MRYHVISPDGVDFVCFAESRNDLDAKASRAFGNDYWIRNDKYKIITDEQYKKQRNQKDSTDAETNKAEEPGLLSRASDFTDAETNKAEEPGLLSRASDFISEAMFPVSMAMASRGAEPSQFLPVAAGEAALNVVPAKLASNIAAKAGLKGLQNLIVRGLAEGAITSLGDYGIAKSGGVDRSAAQAAMTGITSMLPDALQSGVAATKRKALEIAPKVLEYSLVPDKAARNAINKADYKAMLSEGIVTPLGGLEKANERIASKLEPLFDERSAIVKAFDDAVVEKSGIVVKGRKFDLNEIEERALNDIKSQSLSPAELKAARARIREEFDAMRNDYGRYVRAGDIDEVRNKIQARYTELREPVSEYAKEATRSALGDELKAAVPGYAEKTQEMARYMPMRDVVESRIKNRQKPIIMLRDMPGMGLAGLGTASLLTQDPGMALAGPGLLLSGLATSGGARLFLTPGGAAMLYRYGTSKMGNNIVPVLKPLALGMARDGER